MKTTIKKSISLLEVLPKKEMAKIKGGGIIRRGKLKKKQTGGY